MRRVLLLFAASLLCAPRAASPRAGSPLGPEFRVNTYTTGTQFLPNVAANTVGGFLAVWVDQGQDGDSSGVFAQRYAASGVPDGPEFRVNTSTTSIQVFPAAAFDSAGGFVVIWDSVGQDGSNSGIFGQRYAGSGEPLGTEFRVNTYTTGSQGFPSVAADGSGNFIVVWHSLGQDGSSYGVFGQRLSNAGIPLGAEFRVNTFTTSAQRHPSVGADATGNFVVAWQSDGQEISGNGVYAQRYSSSGAAMGSEFRVNSYTSFEQRYPSVACDPTGMFVVVWDSSFQDGSGQGVFGQRYSSSGGPLGPEFRVNSHTTNVQRFPSVGADALGNFVVVWESQSEDFSGYGIFGQRYAASGTALGPEFRVNSYSIGNQETPVVAADASGNFVVLWTSEHDNLTDGIFGQRYGQISPVDLMHLTVE